MNVLEVEQLVKNYGTYTAVDHISFVVPKGKVVGFLGPNGAGKTTTIQMLTGITSYEGGTIKYFGDDFATHKQKCLQRINFTSSYNSLQNRISVFENLLVYSMLYSVKNPKPKINELLKYFQVEELRDEMFLNLSAGQKTRINLIKSLINEPELILMDEPTASLDPDIADKTLSLVEQLKKDRHLSILFTSHNMDEVTRICDEVIILDHGKIVAQDTPVGLTKRVSTAYVELIFDNARTEVEKFLVEKQYKYTFLHDHSVRVELEEKQIPKLIFGMSKAEIWMTDIDIKKPSLEDFFLQIARGTNNVT